MLLTGVNDDAATLKQLFHGLLRMRVRPYYLYQADPVVGTGHLRTSIGRGSRSCASCAATPRGYAVPTYVVDAPGGGGKVPLQPETIVGCDDGALAAAQLGGARLHLPRPAGPVRVSHGLAGRSRLRQQGGLPRRRFSPLEVMEFDDEDVDRRARGALGRLGHRVVRIGRGRELARRLAAGERWDLVFNVAEGVRGRAREAQVPALCELFDQPYTFADPVTCGVTLDKAMAKRIVRDAGLATAPFAVVARPRRTPTRVALEAAAVRQADRRGQLEGRHRPLDWSSGRGELPAAARELLLDFPGGAAGRGATCPGARSRSGCSATAPTPA